MALVPVNLTDHDLRLIDEESNREVVLHSSGFARVRSCNDVQEYIVVDGAKIPIIEVVERTMFDLPPPKENVLYVVSGLVAAVSNRPDVLSPARLRRNKDGTVRGARALLRHHRKDQ